MNEWFINTKKSRRRKKFKAQNKSIPEILFIRTNLEVSFFDEYFVIFEFIL